jgi:hypothetical protein
LLAPSAGIARITAVITTTLRDRYRMSASMMGFEVHTGKYEKLT